MRITEARKLVEEAFEKAAKVDKDVGKRSALFTLGGTGLGAGLGLLASEFVGDEHEGDPELARLKRKRRRVSAILGGAATGGLGGLGLGLADGLATASGAPKPLRKGSLLSRPVIGGTGAALAAGATFWPQLRDAARGFTSKQFGIGGEGGGPALSPGATVPGQNFTVPVRSLKDILANMKEYADANQNPDASLLDELANAELYRDYQNANRQAPSVLSRYEGRIRAGVAGAGSLMTLGSLLYPSKKEASIKERVALRELTREKQAIFGSAANNAISGLSRFGLNLCANQINSDPVGAYRTAEGVAQNAGRRLRKATWRGQRRSIQNMMPDHMINGSPMMASTLGR